MSRGARAARGSRWSRGAAWPRLVRLERDPVALELRRDECLPRRVRLPDARNCIVRALGILAQLDRAVQEHERGRAQVDLAMHQHFSRPESTQQSAEQLEITLGGAPEIDGNVHERKPLTADDPVLV